MKKHPLAFLVFFALCILSHLSALGMAVCGGNPDVIAGLFVAAILYGLMSAMEAPLW
jgi:hypothetical protein